MLCCILHFSSYGDACGGLRGASLALAAMADGKNWDLGRPSFYGGFFVLPSILVGLLESTRTL